MFKTNTKHTQPGLFSTISQLPEKQRKKLEASWADTFYREVFSRINEDIFSVLYTDFPSRPNIPINVFVGLEIQKAGRGWSDAELFERFSFDVQVRYSVGYDQLGEGDFAIRSLYYFRERLAKHFLETGNDLLEVVFEDITDKQIEKMAICTGMQRMDSTQIASNIVDASRLRLLVGSIQRTYRILSEADKKELEEIYAPYCKGSAGQYSYHVKGKEANQKHLEQVGISIQRLLAELAEAYAEESAYQVLERIFSEHYKIVEKEIKLKKPKEISSGSLQSLDDLGASYRTKVNKHYKGYVANIAETCDPKNDLQLITKVQVEPNNISDDQMLADALPELEERTDIETLRVDGGYGGEASDEVAENLSVEVIQSAIRGTKAADPTKLHLADFDVQQDKNGDPTEVTCPQGERVKVKRARVSGWQGRFDPEICAACPFQKEGRCLVKKQKRDPRSVLSFTLKELRAAKRRKAYCVHRKDEGNLRAAVEATMRSSKISFPAGKLPVRGKFRVTSMMIASVLHVNMRRIWKYEADISLFSLLFRLFRHSKTFSRVLPRNYAF
jgi:hypothetical protein